MVSGKVVVGIPGTLCVIVGLIAVWLKSRDKLYDSMNESHPLWEAVSMDWSIDKIAEEGFPTCYRPQIYRNALKYPKNGECKTKDNCVSYIRNRLISQFGNRNIPLFSADSINGKTEVIWSELSDFLENGEKYSAYNVEGFTRVGTADEYSEFLGFDESLQDYSALKNMGSNGKYGKYTIMGTTFYLVDNTPLHLEWGTNFYMMLGGRKRWLLVHPKYYSLLNCNLGKRALHGHCHPESPRMNNYTLNNVDVPLDVYKDVLLNEYKIPPQYMIDITLNPGDILVSCDLWLHATKKLDDNGMAMSLRTAQPWSSRPLQTTSITRFFESIYNGIYCKLFEKQSFHTFVDWYSEDMLENDPRYENPESFTCKNQ